MIVRLGMAPRLRGHSLAQFQHHWRTSHADAVARMPNLRRYVQNHAVLRDGRLTLPYPGFDACSELEFDDLEAMDAGFSSEHYLSAVRADEDAFVDKTRFSMVLGNRVVVRDGEVAGDDPVKLITLSRAHPVAGPAALVEAVLGGFAERCDEAGGVLRHEVIVTAPEAHQGRVPAVADVVSIQWFADVAAAEAHLASPARSSAELELAGRAFGRADLLARQITVV
jgi:uncharacterized protein (TIGR02118 family)